MSKSKVAFAGINLPNENWFHVNASSRGEVEVVIYDEIGGWGITAKSFQEELNNKNVFSASNVIVRIHSGGGDVFEGVAIYNILKGIKGKLSIYIDGLAASIATVISSVPNATVYIPENAWFYLHEAWGIQTGEASDMREYADFLDRNVSNMVSAYMEKTGKSEEEIRAIMAKPGTWLEGREAVDLGFADELLPPMEAAASISENRQKELPDMPEKLKTLIAPKAQVPTPNNPTPDDRQNKIKAMFAAFELSDSPLLSVCLNDAGCSFEAAKAKLLAQLGKSTEPSDSFSAASYIFAGNGDITKDAITQALEARAGYAKADKDNPYKLNSLFDMARASLVDKGVSISSMGSRQSVVGLAFTHTSSDFGNILIDVADKSVAKGWEEAPETFEKWTQKGELSNFREHNTIGLDGFKSLRKVPEGAEYKYVTTDDYKGEPIALATYGELFTITRQAIINDDFRLLTTIPQKFGRAAKRTVADLVYAILIENRNLSDGKPLFSSDHGNIITGALDVDSISAGRLKMRMQKDNIGNVLNISPSSLLVPAELETKATTTIKSTSIEGGSNSGIINPVNGLLNIIPEPRLDEHSNKEFYLLAGDQTIEVAYLDGIDMPYIEQQSGFSVDGVATKVRIDAGVAPIDHRSMVRSSGQ